MQIPKLIGGKVSIFHRQTTPSNAVNVEVQQQAKPEEKTQPETNSSKEIKKDVSVVDKKNKIKKFINFQV